MLPLTVLLAVAALQIPVPARPGRAAKVGYRSAPAAEVVALVEIVNEQYRGRFGTYLPPLLEALGLAELTHDARYNRIRAIES